MRLWRPEAWPWVTLRHYNLQWCNASPSITNNTWVWTNCKFSSCNQVASGPVPKVHDDFMIWIRFLHYSPFAFGIHPIAGNEHPKWPAMWIFVFFAVRLNKLLSKQSNCFWFETSLHSCDTTIVTHIRSPYLFANLNLGHHHTTYCSEKTNYKYKKILQNIWMLIRISLPCVSIVRINIIPAMVKIMAWCWPGDNQLSEPMMISLLTYICVTRPQWVKYSSLYIRKMCNYITGLCKQ